MWYGLRCESEARCHKLAQVDDVEQQGLPFHGHERRRIGEEGDPMEDKNGSVQKLAVKCQGSKATGTIKIFPS